MLNVICVCVCVCRERESQTHEAEQSFVSLDSNISNMEHEGSNFNYILLQCELKTLYTL